LAPIVHGLESEYYDKINFVYLDVDDPANETFKEQFDFRYQPQLILLDGEGQIVQQWIGPVPKEEFVIAFENILNQ
jgi:thioredoxin-related protein